MTGTLASTPERLALPYKVVRTGIASGNPGGGPAALIPGTGLRVLAYLLGIWDTSDGGCGTADEIHFATCLRERPFTVRSRGLTRMIFGGVGGSQVGAVRLAVTALNDAAFSRHGAEQPSPLGAFEHAGPMINVSLSPEIISELRDRRFQYIPRSVLQLHGTNLRFWLQIVCHPRYYKVVGGQPLEPGVGLSNSMGLDPSRLGIKGLNRPSKVLAALERAIAAGRGLHTGVSASLVPSKGGGWKVVVRRSGRLYYMRDAVRGSTQSTTSEGHTKDVGRAVGGHLDGMRGTLSRHSEDAPDRDIGSTDHIQDLFIDPPQSRALRGERVVTPHADISGAVRPGDWIGGLGRRRHPTDDERRSYGELRWRLAAEHQKRLDAVLPPNQS